MPVLLMRIKPHVRYRTMRRRDRPRAQGIHEGAAGANGPVIVPFTKTGDNTFTAPEGAKPTESQYASYRAGNLYVNVHSAKNPSGEVRAPAQRKLMQGARRVRRALLHYPPLRRSFAVAASRTSTIRR